MLKKTNLILLGILIFTLNLFAGQITLKDGRHISGLITVVNDKTVTVDGNQGFYQFQKKEIDKLKLDKDDIQKKIDYSKYQKKTRKIHKPKKRNIKFSKKLDSIKDKICQKFYYQLT